MVQTMLKKYGILYIIIIVIFTTCTYNQLSNHRPIQGLSLHDTLSIAYPVDKVCYTPIERTFVFLNRDENNIRIYKNGDFFNVIGGSGFSNENFRRLVDICVGMDGSIYALDSFDQSIKRFDKDGIFVNRQQLNNIPNPERFLITSYGSFFVFDSHSKEIFVLDAFDMSIKFTFGKFQVDRADSFIMAGEYINIFDSEIKESTIFLTNGMYENTFKSFTIYDAFRNLLSIDFNTIVASRVDKMIFSSENNIALFNIERDLFIIGLNVQEQGFRLGGINNNNPIKEIHVYRGIYE